MKTNYIIKRKGNIIGRTNDWKHNKRLVNHYCELGYNRIQRTAYQANNERYVIHTIQ